MSTPPSIAPIPAAIDLATERQALALFQRLMDAEPAAQQSAIASLQTEQPQVAARVAKMLLQHQATTGQQFRQLTHQLFQELPRELGPFRIVGLIGEGGMGRVVRGVRQIDRGEQQVAIKLVYAPPSQHVLRERFLRERELLARLQHPAIAALIDFGETPDGLLWYAMALIDGVAVTSYAQQAKIDLPAKLRLILDLCEVLRYAHALGVIHRDIKPQNVLVNADGELHLIDFGIAKAIDDDSNLSLLGNAPMTPRYASPEQRQRGAITTATDQWQAAALFYELLTGQHYSSSNPERVRHWNSSISVDLDAVLMKALRSDVPQRYDSMAQFADDLRACMHRRPVQARMGEHWYELKSFVSHYRWALASAAIAMLSLCIATWYSYQAAERASRQARIAERANNLLSEIFLSDEQGPNLPQLTLGGLIANGIDLVMLDHELPVAARMNLLDELAERASEAEEYAASVRGSEEVLRLSKALQPPDAIAVGEAKATLAMILLGSPSRIERDTEIRDLIAAAKQVQPLQSKAQAQLAITTHRAQAFYHAYQNNFDPALVEIDQAQALTKQWLADDPWAQINAMRTRAVMYAAANRSKEAADIYQLITDYADQWTAKFPKLANIVQWDRAQLCEQLSFVDATAGLVRCQANVALLEQSNQAQSLVAFENLSGWGRCLAKLDRAGDALAMYQRAEQILVKLEGDASLSLRMASIRRRIGNRMIELGKSKDALLPLEFALSAAKFRLPAEHRDVLEIRAELAFALMQAGNLARARVVLEEVKNAEVLGRTASRYYQETLSALAKDRAK
jgi:serine/threonine protein kinase